MDTTEALISALEDHFRERRAIGTAEKRLAELISEHADRSPDTASVLKKIAYTIQFAAKRTIDTPEHPAVGTREALNTMFSRATAADESMSGLEIDKIVDLIDEIVINKDQTLRYRIVSSLAYCIKAVSFDMEIQSLAEKNRLWKQLDLEFQFFEDAYAVEFNLATLCVPIVQNITRIIDLNSRNEDRPQYEGYRKMGDALIYLADNMKTSTYEVAHTRQDLDEILRTSSEYGNIFSNENEDDDILQDIVDMVRRWPHDGGLDIDEVYPSQLNTHYIVHHIGDALKRVERELYVPKEQPDPYTHEVIKEALKSHGLIYDEKNIHTIDATTLAHTLAVCADPSKEDRDLRIHKMVVTFAFAAQHMMVYDRLKPVEPRDALDRMIAEIEQKNGTVFGEHAPMIVNQIDSMILKNYRSLEPPELVTAIAYSLKKAGKKLEERHNEAPPLGGIDPSTRSSASGR